MNDLKSLIIGSTDLKNLDEATNCLVATCKELDVSYNFSEIAHNKLDSLNNEEIDCLAYPLHLIPINKPEGFVIAGLSERQNVLLKIITHADNKDINNILKLKANCTIGVVEASLKEQISYLFPNYKVILFDKLDLLSKALLEKEITAIVDWNPNAMKGFETLTAVPKELLPPAGYGTYAFLTQRSNMDARKAIQEIHEPEVAYCTNVERKISKFLGADSKVAAHCTIDRMGNYHLDVFAKEKGGNFKKIKLSQSTFIQLAENACRKLSYEVSDI